MFKQTSDLTDEEKRVVSKMCGKIMLWTLEDRSLQYMVENLKMHPWQIEENIGEIIFTLTKKIGIKKTIRMIFYKK